MSEAAQRSSPVRDFGDETPRWAARISWRVIVIYGHGVNVGCGPCGTLTVEAASVVGAAR